MAGKDVARPERKPVKFDKLPERFFQIINPEAWVNSILYGDKYTEPDPDFISRLLAAQAIFADTVEEAFASAGVKKLQQWLPDQPGASIGPLEMTDLYVAESDFETGNPTFVLISGVMLESGEEFKVSTGATNVQATIIGLLRLGHWPIRFQFKRGDSKDKGGKYLIFVLPPD
jgi:hypothetical protein